MDGLYYGLCTIVPDVACYPEMYPKECLFHMFGPVPYTAPKTIKINEDKTVRSAIRTLENLLRITNEESISFPIASAASQGAANKIFQVLCEEAHR